VVDGWCSVEELTRLGFARSPVVMANEAHNGMTRCVRTREVGVRMIQAAHQAGVRRLAMETLPSPTNDAPEPIRAIPSRDPGYLAQPDMRRLITTALELGWSLWAYEARVEFRKDKADLLSPSPWPRPSTPPRSTPKGWVEPNASDTIFRLIGAYVTPGDAPPMAK
jgi:hypothetical protein